LIARPVAVDGEADPLAAAVALGAALAPLGDAVPAGVHAARNAAAPAAAPP
jgi:hypothetical protein